MTEKLSINLCQIPDICNVDTTIKKLAVGM